jgi:hypothetical protein
VDAFVLVAIIVVAMPVAVFAALAISARLRGPMSRPESRKRVGSLVTEAIPEEHRHDEEDLETGPPFNLDSSPPEPDPQLRSRDAG